jgi:hypothetical protein
MTLQARGYGDIPKRPAVYVMYGGLPPRIWAAYVGITKDLNGRLVQHFDKRDSSVVTGTAAAGINIDAVRVVRWWEDPRFADTAVRHAAETVAFDIFEPALRSRGGGPPRDAKSHLEDTEFCESMKRLFADPPAGEFWIPQLWEVAASVRELEGRLVKLEDELRTLREATD